MNGNDESIKQEIDRERDSLVARLHDWLEVPMLVLAFAWLALFVIEALRGEISALRQELRVPSQERPR